MKSAIVNEAPVSVRRCPILKFTQALGGKYKLWLVFELKHGPVRYGALRRGLIDAAMPRDVTARVLSRELKELQAQDLIVRREISARPLQVEYRLTARGEKLIPVIEAMVLWIWDKPVPRSGRD